MTTTTQVDGSTVFVFDDPYSGQLILFKILQAQAMFAKNSGSTQVSIRHDGQQLLGINVLD